MQVAGNAEVDRRLEIDEGRAYHSAYFEMLGEQGYPGLLSGSAPFRRTVPDGGASPPLPQGRRGQGLVAGLATALQHAHFIYLLGAVFVGIAFQSFAYMWIAVEIGLEAYCRRMEAAGSKAGWGGKPAAKPAAAGAL